MDRIGRNKVESRWGMIIRDLDREEREKACLYARQLDHALVLVP